MPPGGPPPPTQYPPGATPSAAAVYNWHLGAKPGVVPLRPLTLGDLFDGSFQVLRRMPGAVFGWAVIVATVLALVQTGAQWLLARDMVALFDELETGPTDATGTSMMRLVSLAQLGSSFLALAATVVLTGLLAGPVGRAVTGHRMSFGDVWRTGRPLARVLAWAVILAATATAVLAAGAGLVIALGVLVHPGFFALAFVVAPALFLAALWAFATLSFPPAAMVLERTSLWAGVRRSLALVRGSFWRVLGILVVGYLVVMLVASVLAFPVSMLSSVLAFVNIDDPRAAAGATPLQLTVTTIGSIIAQSVALPFMACLTNLLYIDLRIRREGLDVQLARAAAENP